VLETVSDLGLRTRAGRKVSPQTFGQMLRNPIYAGWLTVPKWGRERRRGDFEPLVSEDVFEQVQAVLEGRKPIVAPHRRNHPDFPLRRFVRCGHCSTPLTGSWSTGRANRYAYYHCRRAGCRAVTVPKADLEAKFIAYLGQLVSKPEYMVLLFQEIVLETWKRTQVEAAEASKMLTRKLEELRAAKDHAFVH